MSKVNHRASMLDLSLPEVAKVMVDNVVPFRRGKAVPKRAKVVAYTFDASKQQGPSVGDTVAVRHRTSVDAKGHIRLVRDGIDERRVKRVYFTEAEGYSIMDTAGEQWLVRPSAVGGCKWETFSKGEGRKELQ